MLLMRTALTLRKGKRENQSVISSNKDTVFQISLFGSSLSVSHSVVSLKQSISLRAVQQSVEIYAHHKHTSIHTSLFRKQ